MTVWVVSIIDPESGYEAVDCVTSTEKLAEQAAQEITELYNVEFPGQVKWYSMEVIEE